MSETLDGMLNECGLEKLAVLSSENPNKKGHDPDRVKLHCILAHKLAVSGSPDQALSTLYELFPYLYTRTEFSLVCDALVQAYYKKNEDEAQRYLCKLHFLDTLPRTNPYKDLNHEERKIVDPYVCASEIGDFNRGIKGLQYLLGGSLAPALLLPCLYWLAQSYMIRDDNNKEEINLARKISEFLSRNMRIGETHYLLAATGLANSTDEFDNLNRKIYEDVRDRFPDRHYWAMLRFPQIEAIYRSEKV